MHKQIEKYYAEHYRMLVKKYAGWVGGMQNAEDVVQEAFYRALKYHKSYDPERQELGCWIHKILNNASRDFKKKERLLGMGVEYQEKFDDGVPLMDWEDDMIESIKEDIARKPEHIRQVLWLYIIKQYKPREIAQIVETSNDCIRTSVKEFKQKMRKKYGDIV